MRNDQVVGNGRDVHGVEGSGRVPDGYRRGRSRRVGSGAIHQRLLNRQRGWRTATVDSTYTAFGHNASTAATIAATSSSVGDPDTSTLIGAASAEPKFW
ncbi:MAG TPA: hypothetical protein VGC84_13955 [Ilumatobacteraceae bacterium]|jgi:hypothetical protein